MARSLRIALARSRPWPEQAAQREMTLSEIVAPFHKRRARLLERGAVPHATTKQRRQFHASCRGWEGAWVKSATHTAAIPLGAADDVGCLIRC